MGLLDDLFSNKKEKTSKSEKSKKAASNANRVSSRPPIPSPNPNKRQQQAPSSIFGSLKRLKGGVATSTSKKTSKDDNKNKNNNNPKKQDDKFQDRREEIEIKSVEHTVDANANIESVDGVAVTSYNSINSHVTVRKRGKENVEQRTSKGDTKERVVLRGVTAGRAPEDLKKERVKSSALSLSNVLRVQSKPTQSQQPKPKRPVTLAIPSNVTVRRGHKEGQGHPDNISRTSSVTNLDSLESNLQVQQGKGAKPRKVASKERIDKQGQDGKKVPKNNNKLAPPPQPVSVPPLSYSTDSLHEVELQHLRQQLREMSDEKSSLALQLGEQRGQLNVLQKEIQKLKAFQEESGMEMEKLAEENTALRNRLRDVAHSPLSDNEKQQLLFESRHHSSAPASIATNVVEDNGGDATTCTTPDWDKHSSGNVSEVSVACLQDKINQMQETHYSTNEELQATLQELTDLQRQLTELQQENERLNEEKTLMFDSLCRQTERLNDSRQEVENLKQLLYRDRSDETGVNQLESAAEREQKLVDLLRSAQEEREQLLLKLEQMQAELQDSRAENIGKADAIAQLTERVKTLECTLDAKHAEHKQLDQELAQAKDQCSGKQIEINRLTDLLENARTKINELEQDRTLSDKSELDELLDNARKEKDQLESEVAYLKEQLARSKNEIEKLKEQVFVLQEECKVTRNNAKTTQSDLEYKCEKLVAEKNTLGEQLQQFQEAVNELQVQAQCHLEDKRQLSAVLSETQRNLSEAERRNLNLETEIQELKKLKEEENDEWEKFQNDLLTSVRVANDFKTEAQQELQKIILENKTYREKVRLLEGQVEKLKGEKILEKTATSTQTDIILTPQLISLAKNLDQSIPNRLSLLEHPITPGIGSPTTPTHSMDKLFPILSKERKSKSKENLADDGYRGSETSIRRSRNRENLSSIDGSKRSTSTKSKKSDKSKEKVDEKEEKAVAIEEPKKEKKSFFKRSKSRDNLEKGKVSDETSKTVGETSKGGSLNFLKRNKSKDNLDQLAVVDGSTQKKNEDLTKKETSLLDKPRKSKDSIESSSSSSKSEVKPVFGKLIKKRDKKMQSHRKTMSVEEGMLLKSLDDWYEHIDQNIPEELLSKEDRAVKKLKVLFENDQLKEKPVAHKPKEQLAISKPLLNSVVQNPKLDEIVRDPRFPTVETQVRESALEEPLTLVNEEPGTSNSGPRYRLRSEEVYTNIGPKSMGIHKSKSLDDLNVFEEYRTESELAPVLYRAAETDNLATERHLEIKQVPRQDSVFSDINPNDSVSNPRYSTRYHDVQLKEYVTTELPKPNIYINYENLDEIVDKIPKNVPDSKLTEEQRFARKLRLALDEAEKNNTIKKMKKKKHSIKGMEISAPTTESVQKNWKLKEIILNPRIRKAEEVKKDKFFLDLFDETERKRHSTDISSDIGELDDLKTRPAVTKSQSMSKSYEDISFSFVPENTLLGLYYGEKDKRRVSDSSSSSHSFTSAEFNLDTGKITQQFDIPTDVHIKQGGSYQKEDVNPGNEDLLYNETINKEKNKKKSKTKQPSENSEYNESLEKLKLELAPSKTKDNQVEEDDHQEKDYRILGSLEKYKRDLNQMVKRIDSDELRDSLRRRKKLTEFETQYQIAHSETVFDEYEVNFVSPLEATRNNQQKTVNNGIGKERERLETGPEKVFEEQDKVNFVKNDKTDLTSERNSSVDVINETVIVPSTSDALQEFISKERQFAEDYNFHHSSSSYTDKRKPLQHNPDRNSAENEFQITFIAPADKNYLSGSLDDNKESLKIKREPKELADFQQKRSTVEDFVSKKRSYRVSYNFDDRKSGSAEVNRPKSLQIFDSDPKDNLKVAVDPLDNRFQRPFEVNTNFETSSLTLLSEKQLPLEKHSTNTIDENENEELPTNLQINQLDLIEQGSPMSIDSSKDIETVQNRTINIENTNKESVPHPVYLKERIIFQYPTGWEEAKPLVPEESKTDWPAPEEERNHSYVESINLPQRNEYLGTDSKDQDAGSQIIVEQVTYQMPFTSLKLTEFENVLKTTESAEDDILGTPDKYISYTVSTEPTVSHLGSPNTADSLPSDENIYYATTVDLSTPQYSQINEEYNYQQTLKEDQYGVISPLNIRYTYRGVVKEYKDKYPQDQTEEIEVENSKESDVDDLEYNDDFIDDFFKPPKPFDQEFESSIEEIDQHSEDIQKVEPENFQALEAVVTDEDVDIRRKEAVSEIDKEMQSIMEQYLHTRASLIVRKTGVDIEDEKGAEHRINLKKDGDIENLHEIEVPNKTKENDDENRHLDDNSFKVVCTNEDIQNVEPESEENEELSLEDLKFIEEMKAKYTSHETVPIVSEKNTTPIITEEEIEDKYQHLTEEELSLIRSSRNDRYSRPLSDINERDLLLIDEISRRYFKDSSLPSSVRNSLQEERKDAKKHIEESTEVEDTVAIIKQKDSIPPPLPLSELPKMSKDLGIHQPYSFTHLGIEAVDNSLNRSSSQRVSLGNETKPSVDTTNETITVVTSEAIKDFIFNERKFSSSCIAYSETYLYIQTRDSKQSSIPPTSVEFQNIHQSHSHSSDVDTHTKDTSSVATSRILNLSQKEEKVGSSGNNVINIVAKGIENYEPDFKKRKDISHLPPSLRPRKPASQLPVASYQPQTNVIYRDKKKSPSAQESIDRLSSNIDGASRNRLSDLIFKETIFVPVSKDDTNSPIMKSPLSPGNNPIEEQYGATWKTHEKPDFKQTIVVPTPQYHSILTMEAKSPQLKPSTDHSSKETIFVPVFKDERSLTLTKVQEKTGFQQANVVPAPQEVRPLISPEIRSPSPQAPHSPIFKETLFIPSTAEPKETIFVPVFKDERPLTLTTVQEKTGFQQANVVPAPQKVRPLISPEIRSPPPQAPRSPIFKETLFIPSTAEPKETPTPSITRNTPDLHSSYSRTNSGDLGFKETIIIPAKQRSAPYSYEIPDSPKDPTQPQISVTTVNKPGYQSYKETIIIPKSHESPEAKDQISELFSVKKSITQNQEFVTQSQTSSRSEVKVNLNRYSAIPQPIVRTRNTKTTERRSWSEPFKSRTLDRDLGTYEPVYSNINFSTNTYKGVFSSEIKKNPLPVPRSTEYSSHSKSNEYLTGITSPKLDSDNRRNDTLVNMTDPNKNFSEVLANKDGTNFKTGDTSNFEQFQALFPQDTSLKDDKRADLVKSEDNFIPYEKNIPSDQVILTESKAETDILKSKDQLILEPKPSTDTLKNLENAPNPFLGKKGMADFVNRDGQSTSSGSSSTVRSSGSIVISTKDEQLDIPRIQATPNYLLDEDVEEIVRKPSDAELSNVNLFNMGSHSSYDSYLEIFRTKESRDFDDLRGKKSPIRNFFNMPGFAYVEEISVDDIGSDNIQQNSSDNVKPKIVDFVPLDDDTTPFFTKTDITKNYDTLEREKTFQVLDQASKMSDKQSKESANSQIKQEEYSKTELEVVKKLENDKSNPNSSVEVLAKKSSSFSKASSKSQTNTSFTQAKKIFEALLEANKDERPKSAVGSRSNKSPVKYNVRDSKSLEHVKIPLSVSKEAEIPIVGETGLIVKDEGTVDPETPKKF